MKRRGFLKGLLGTVVAAPVIAEAAVKKDREITGRSLMRESPYITPPEVNCSSVIPLPKYINVPYDDWDTIAWEDIAKQTARHIRQTKFEIAGKVFAQK